MTTRSPVRIHADRLWTSLMLLAEVATFTDATTGLTGVNRLSLTDADSAAFGALRATIGRLSLSPGLANVVPQRAEVTVDLGNPDEVAVGAAEGALAAYAQALCMETPGLRIETTRLARTRAVPFDGGVQKAIGAAMDDLGLEHMTLMPGGGHDAQEIAAIAPAAMIFVRGEYDGISHNPREYSTPQACARGADVLATTLFRLANED